MVKDNSTEQKILDAARSVFIQKGLDGARMQEIANEAGINKALLHYYFRSKDKLFDRIFSEAFDTISTGLGDVFSRDIPLMDKFKNFIDLYIDVLSKNPHLPVFVFGELSRNPERLQKGIEKNMNNIMGPFFIQMMQEVNLGRLRPIHPAHLMLNMIGMLVIPYVARPMIAPILKQHLNIDFQDILDERKEVIYKFISDALIIDEK
ncbi:MAG: TetR/AcrR family transcriptional regulator [Bacteroidales bacterium]|nr:TetR/AcrR family transcriptional regulator [Bacteroidales bacterium]MBN2818285.1 TetR/AcrR family transcriptional regulator [Bacteroidales bacterium]